MDVTALLVTLNLLQAALAAMTGDIELGLRPVAGLQLERSYTESIEMNLQSSSLQLHRSGFDDPIDCDDHGIFGESRSLRFLDTFVEVAQSCPLQLQRCYLQLDGENEHSRSGFCRQAESSAKARHSKLDGGVITFLQTADCDVPQTLLNGRAIDEDLARVLEPDADLVELLPARRVNVGDEWEAPSGALLRLLALGAPVDMPSRPRTRNPLHAEVGMSLEGAVRVRLDGIDEIDGQKCAVMTFRVDLASRTEIEAEDLGMPLAFVGEVSGPGTVRELLELKGEGRFLWDAGAHHMRELTMETDLRLERGERFSEPPNGPEVSTLEVWWGEVDIQYCTAPFEDRR